MNRRRLATILMADAVGYTSRMAVDEEATLRLVSSALKDLQSVIADHNGRTVKTMGDGLLAEFESVANAVSAAATFQRDLSSSDGADAMPFRIGIHMGEVFPQPDGDIVGSGVNIAARLEQQAGPGCVFVSAQVFDQISGKTDEEFEEIGLCTLKGIERPQHVYAVRLPNMGDVRANAQLALPDKLSIAVLPLANRSSDPEQEYFADGLTEDLITALSGAASLFVIARNSSFAYKGQSPDMDQLQRELGVRYVLSGSVRKAGNTLRVTADLNDTDTGRSLWSKRLDGSTDDIFDFQDQIIDDVVSLILPSIQSNEAGRAISKRPNDLTAYDYLLRALDALNTGATVDAMPLLDQAITRAPTYGKALALRAWANTVNTVWAGNTDSATIRAEAIDLAQRALANAKNDPEVQGYASYVLSFYGEDTETAFTRLRSVVDRCPNFVWALVSLAAQEALRGDPARAVALCDQAERLNPRDTMAFRLHSTRALTAWVLCDWEGQLEHATRTLNLMPNMMNMMAHVIVANHLLGRWKERDRAVAEFKAKFPEYHIATHEKRLAQQKNLAGEPLAKYMDSLRAVGFPE